MIITRTCHCGRQYKAKSADIARGWALSCSKRCAAVKRESTRHSPMSSDQLPGLDMATPTWHTSKTAFELATVPKSPPSLQVVPRSQAWGRVLPRSLGIRYRTAVQDLYTPWAEISPADRFEEYDEHRAVWAEELYSWLYRGNPRGIRCMTHFAWDIQHERLSQGGTCTVCLNFNTRSQRFFLGDGLLQYLGLLKDDMETLYGEPTS